MWRDGGDVGLHTLKHHQMVFYIYLPLMSQEIWWWLWCCCWCGTFSFVVFPYIFLHFYPSHITRHAKKAERRDNEKREENSISAIRCTSTDSYYSSFYGARYKTERILFFQINGNCMKSITCLFRWRVSLYSIRCTLNLTITSASELIEFSVMPIYPKLDQSTSQHRILMTWSGVVRVYLRSWTH